MNWPTSPLPPSERGPVGEVRRPPGYPTNLWDLMGNRRMLDDALADIRRFDHRFARDPASFTVSGLAALAAIVVAGVAVLVMPDRFRTTGAVLGAMRLPRAFLRCYGSAAKWHWGMHRIVKALNELWTDEANERTPATKNPASIQARDAALK